MGKSKTKVRDIMHAVKARKRTWTGHITRLKDNRWTSQVTDWIVVDQELDTQRDGGMKSMPFRDRLHGSLISKTDFHGKAVLRPSSNKCIENGSI